MSGTWKIVEASMPNSEPDTPKNDFMAAMPDSKSDATAAEDLKNTYIAELQAKLTFREAYHTYLATQGPDYFEGMAKAEEITKNAESEFITQMSPEVRAAYFSRTPDQLAREKIDALTDAAAGMTSSDKFAYQEHLASLRRAASREIDSWPPSISARQESAQPWMRAGAQAGGGTTPRDIPSWGDYDSFGSGSLKRQAVRDAHSS